ncbi:MAG: protein TolA, partial [Betaproteobacteria bacterium]|nr:protein TolA [Betaproteobacteria bacterium]
TIIGRKLISSSGNKAWDEAVLKAIDKTEKLPRDVDGRIHSPLIIGFKPRE